MSDERPKPPRPAPFIPSRPKSDPSIRAAGLERPQAKTDPSIANEKLREYQREVHAATVARHDDEIRELRQGQEAFKRHAAKVEKAWGLDEESAAGESDPPPARSLRRRKPRTKVDAIELDSLKAKYGIYVLFGCWVAEKVLTYFHVLPGGR